MKFPRKLNEIHKFQINDRRYIADITNQITLEVDEIIIEILELCETHNTLNIISHLRDRYTYDDLRRAFNRLEQFSELGFLFDIETSQFVSNINGKTSVKIFIPLTAVIHRAYISILTKLANARLLESLSKLCGLVVQVPEKTEHLDLQLEDNLNIEYVRFPENGMLHWMSQIPVDCNGVLLLNPRAYTDLVLYQHLDIPIVSFVHSTELIDSLALNKVLNSYSLMKPRDKLIVDSIWLPFFLERYDINRENLVFIPPSLSLGLTPECDARQKARDLAYSLLPGQCDTSTKIILIVSAFNFECMWEFAHHMGHIIPNSKIILVGHYDFVPFSERVLAIKLSNMEDLELLSLILLACDATVTIGGPGAEPSILFESLSANIPSVIVGQAGVGCVANKLNLNENIYFVELPSMNRQCLLSNARFIGQRLNEVLKVEVAYNSSNGKLHWDWMKCASEVYRLFECNNTGTSAQTYTPWYGSTVFSMYYDVYRKSLMPCAHELPNFTFIPFTEGLVKTLKDQHTDREVELVLEAIQNQQAQSNSSQKVSTEQQEDSKVDSPNG